jgi:integrase
MSTQENTEEKPTTWKKVGECLYRYGPSGVIYARIQHRTTEIRRCLKTSSLPEARRKLADLRREIERTDPTMHKATLDQTADRWLATQTHLASSTLKLKTDIVARVKRDWPGGARTPLRSVKTSDVRDWLSRYAVRPSTHNTFLETVSGIFQYAVESGIIATNPARKVERRKRDRPVQLIPKHDDIIRIVSDLRSQVSNGHGRDESADLVLFMAEQGVGQAEVRGLQRQHVDCEGGTITFFRRKTRTAFTVPIMPNIAEMLKIRCSGLKQTDRVFKHCDPKKGLAAACARLGLPAYSPRSLRKQFVTRGLRAGVDVKTLASWQGHVDGGQLILRTYSDEVGAAFSASMAAKMATA